MESVLPGNANDVSLSPNGPNQKPIKVCHWVAVQQRADAQETTPPIISTAAVQLGPEPLYISVAANVSQTQGEPHTVNYFGCHFRIEMDLRKKNLVLLSV